ncbi:MAG: metallophosphoesterase [Anaerolineales bacterium]
MFLVLLAALVGVPLTSAKAATTITFSGVECLGKPTNTSIAINVVPDANVNIYYEYGTASGVYTAQTTTALATGGAAYEVTITGLQPNTRYYYRMQYQVPGDSWVARAEHTFRTQRPTGSTFTFTVTSDSHINVAGLGNLPLYRQALDRIAADNPDFNLDLGDTFPMDGVTTAATANSNYLYQRSADLLGRITPSVPLFLAIGNHENEEGWNFNDTYPQPIYSINARKQYFPTPIQDGFYTGNTDASETRISGDHLREDYYAWQWGDALFIVFDPFQYTMQNPYGAVAGEGSDDPATGDRWNWTLGQQQYNWLTQTLQNSTAKYKFMFAHQMLGGTENYVRGGAAGANWFEWGGYNVDANNLNPTWQFDTKRPGWSKTIRQLMIDNGVSAFFHGHDHEYVYEKTDGIVYQEVPSPSMTEGSYGFSLYSESDPYTLKVLPNAGYLRVTVSPSNVAVQYVDTTTGNITYSYTIGNTATHTITASAGANGSISPSGAVTVTEGNNQSFSITPNSGYQVANVLVDGASVGAVTSYTFTNVLADHTIAASFQATVPSNITYVGDIGSGSIKNSANAVLTVTTTAAVATGQDIIVAYATDPSQNLAVAASDSAGNTYTQVGLATNTGQLRTYIFAAFNVAHPLSSGATISFTQSGGTPAARAAVVSVFSGLADTSVLDKTTTGTGSSAAPATSATSATAQANELLVGAVGTEGPSGDTAGTWSNSFTAGPRLGTTGGTADTNITVSLAWRIVSATGAYTAAKSSITSRDWAALLVTLKAY